MEYQCSKSPPYAIPFHFNTISGTPSVHYTNYILIAPISSRLETELCVLILTIEFEKGNSCMQKVVKNRNAVYASNGCQFIFEQQRRPFPLSSERIYHQDLRSNLRYH